MKKIEIYSRTAQKIHMANLLHTNWDRIFEHYIQSINNDVNADFAFELEVNTPAILSLCPKHADKVLDLGCGDGRFTKVLMNKYRNVFGIDSSQKMVNYCKKHINKSSFYCTNLEENFPKFNCKFHLITAKLLLMYIGNLNSFAKGCSDVISDDGILVISVTHPFKRIDALPYYNLETNLIDKISHEESLEIIIFLRTIETYINTFTKYGFVLELLLETSVPDSFVLKYPQYIDSQKLPKRLNIRFRYNARFS